MTFNKTREMIKSRSENRWGLSRFCGVFGVKWNGAPGLRGLRMAFKASAVCGLLCVLCFGCNRSAGTSSEAGTSKIASAATPIKVTPIVPVRKTLIRIVDQPGQVEAFEEAPLFAKVTGYVRKLWVDLGDAVTGPKFDSSGKLISPGQVLCELDIPELVEEHAQKLALMEQAQANVEQSRAAIDVAEAVLLSSQAKISELEATAEKDQANYDRWKSEARRVAELAKSGSIGQKVAEEAENQSKAADAERRQTVAKVVSAKALIQESKALVEKAKADFNVARSRAKVAAADADRTKTMVEYGQIHAPFDGRISARNIHVGHLVRTSDSSREPLLIVSRIDKVRVVIDVPEADAVLIQDGCEATVRIPSLPGTSFPGKVSRSGWSLNSGTRTLRVEVDVNNTTGSLRQGMYVTGELKAAVRENVISLPRSAVLTQDKGTYCHTIDATGKVQLVPIQLGIQSGTDVEIQQGLSGNERVIGANSSAFKPGQIVEISDPAK
jgi:RND family efflux transporter MFP subunit